MICKNHRLNLFIFLFASMAFVAMPFSSAFSQAATADAKTEADKAEAEKVAALEAVSNRFKKAMPDIPVMDDAEFLKNTKLVRKKPYDENVLAYSMRLPKNWEEGEDRSSSNFILSDKLFLELNTYYSKAKITGRSRIEIQAINLESNLTAEQWYIKYLLEGGYTNQGFVTHSNQKVEALMIVMEQDYSYYLRTLVVINGSKIIMIRYYIPVGHMNDMASMQAKVLESFKLQHEKERELSEMIAYRFLDVAEVKYPVTWKVFAKPMRSVDRMDVTIMNTKEFRSGGQESITTEGKVDILLVSSFVENSLIEEIADFKKNIQENGMLVGEKLPYNVKLKHEKNIDFAITEIYKIVDSTQSQADYELWFTVLVGGNYYYFLTLLTPSQVENYPVWAENTQNYKIMASKLTPMVGAFIGRD